jgi:hypothetical protein
MIRRCDARDFDMIWEIINDGAQAYKGIIPADRWTEPYMARETLRHEIADGVGFWVMRRTAPSQGYRLVEPLEKNRLLKKYWNVPERQIETSVVLADSLFVSPTSPPP